MPLKQGRSKQAFSQNVETEMNEGKPQKQALAIAYNVKRKNMKKMAKGGKVEMTAKSESRPMPEQEFADSAETSRVSSKKKAGPTWTEDTYSDQASQSQSKKPAVNEVSFTTQNRRASIDESTPEEMAMEEESATDPMSINADHAKDIKDAKHMADGGEVDDHYEGIAEAIMRKRKRMMADGGEVDLSRNADEDLNFEDEQSFDAARKENYSESDGLDEIDSAMDSGQHGDDDLDSDSHDMVASIRKKMKSKRA